MAKRIVAGVFWFLAVGYFWNFAGAMWGFPPMLRSCMIAHHSHEETAPADKSLPLIQLACRMANAMGFSEVKFSEEQPALDLPKRVRDAAQLAGPRLRERIIEQIEEIGG